MSLDGHGYATMSGNWAAGNCAQVDAAQHWQQMNNTHAAPCSENWSYSGAYPNHAEMPRVPPMYPHHGLPSEHGYPALQSAHCAGGVAGSIAGDQQQEGGPIWGKHNLLDANNYMQHFSTHATTVARRNERERNRVRHINSTFDNLRQHLPCSSKKKKLSKVDTLRTAIKYINHLQGILGTDMKPLTSQQIKKELGIKKRQSLDSSLNSTSSAEHNPHDEEEETVHDDEDCSRGSPMSSTTSATSSTPVPYGGEAHFQWPSS